MTPDSHFEPTNELAFWKRRIAELKNQLVAQPDQGEKLGLLKKISICEQKIREICSAAPHEVEKGKLNWGSALSDELFCGRGDELSQLVKWVSSNCEHCRLVAILGMGGIGKTSLAVELAKRVESDFRFVIWSSLRDQPPIESILRDIIGVLSTNEFIDGLEVTKKLSFLIEQLRVSRSLLIFDNFESILKERDVGRYKPGFEIYGDFLRRVASVQHNSCVLLTSREKPAEIATLEGKRSLTRSLTLDGLKLPDVKRALEGKRLNGSEDNWKDLVQRYGGNPLSIKIVSEYICELFDCRISEFLARKKSIVKDIRELLDQQFTRLTRLEDLIIKWLAIEREPTSVVTLSGDIFEADSDSDIIDSLNALKRRHLIEKTPAGFTLQNFIMEYVTETLIKSIIGEVLARSIQLFDCICLTKAQSKEYIRRIQGRFIVAPIIDGLLKRFSKEMLTETLKGFLDQLRKTSPRVSGYGANNALTLMSELGAKMDGLDFSGLAIRQANLQDIELHHVNFANSGFQDTTFADTFGSIPAVSWNKTGDLIAAGTFNGQIRVWNVSGFQQILNFEGHEDWVSSVAFSPKDGVLASGSGDQTIKLWELYKGQCIGVLEGHKDRVRSIAFHPNGTLIASASEDHTVRVWHVDGTCVHVAEGHTGRVKAISFSPDGKLLASAGDDTTIRVWNGVTRECITVLKGHSGWVRTLAFSPDSKKILSGGDDGSLRLWDFEMQEYIVNQQADNNRVWSVDFSHDGSLFVCGVDDGSIKLWSALDGRLVRTLKGHSSWVRDVRFHPNCSMLLSGGEDQTIRIWDLPSGECVKTIRGYTKRVFSIAYSPDQKSIIGGLGDHKLHLWDVESGTCLRTFSGHSDQVWAVAFSPSGRYIASGSDDRSVKIWDRASGRCVLTLTGHKGWIGAVAFDNAEKLLASGSDDAAIMLWDISTGRCMRVLHGHKGRVSSLSFSSDNNFLSSGSEDATVKVWNFLNGECLITFRGHTSLVFAVAFNPVTKILASGSGDHTIRLWNIPSRREVGVLMGHERQIWSLSFSPEGKTLASASDDRTVKLWDANSRTCIRTLKGHKRQIWSVAFSPDGRHLASGSEDETVRIWDTSNGACIRILKGNLPYEGMDITGATGLSEAQVISLRSLGAIVY